MRFDDYVNALREHAASLVAAVSDAPLDTRVPTCPDWSLADLLRHLGTHHRWVAGNLTQAPGAGMYPFDQIAPPPDDALPEWVGAGAADLADRLVAVGPDHACWAWLSEQTSATWARRTALETVVHGWDGCNTVGAASAIAGDVASDGIDESLTALLPARTWVDPPASHGTLHVHCTDVDGEWLVTFAADGITTTREHAKGDVAARGPASDLYLNLLGRTDNTMIEIIGDSGRFAQWRDWARF